MKLEEKLVALRKEKGLSQIQLAEMMNVSRQAVSRWEVGASVPSTDNLKYLGKLYDVSLEYLLHDDATESIRVDKEKESDEEKTISTNGTKRTIRSIVLVLIVVGIIAIVLCVTLFGNIGSKGKAPVDMKEREMSKTGGRTYPQTGKWESKEIRASQGRKNHSAVDPAPAKGMEKTDQAERRSCLAER